MGKRNASVTDNTAAPLRKGGLKLAAYPVFVKEVFDCLHHLHQPVAVYLFALHDENVVAQAVNAFAALHIRKILANAPQKIICVSDAHRFYYSPVIVQTDDDEREAPPGCQRGGHRF